MLVIQDLSTWPAELRGGAVSIGNFDGVHRGHAEIVRRLRESAQAVGGPAIVFTFDPHPVRLLRPEAAPPPLTWTARKAQLLARLGVDALLAYPTDDALLALSAEDFFDHIIVERIGARAIVEGPNFQFGRGRAGDVARLAALAAGAGIALAVVQPVGEGGAMVSSSLIRRLVAAGQIDEATALLTAPYRIRGMVVHGAGRGHTMGFPTANLEGVDTLLPGAGVYAGRGFLRRTESTQQRAWPAAVSVGPNPTFGENAVKVEAHLIGCGESFYGEVLEIDFLARLRDIRPYADVNSLKAQLALDVESAARIAALRPSLP